MKLVYLHITYSIPYIVGVRNAYIIKKGILSRESGILQQNFRNYYDLNEIVSISTKALIYIGEPTAKEKLSLNLRLQVWFFNCSANFIIIY